MEIWNDIVGFEGKYAVSNLGNVKTLTHYIKHNILDVPKIVRERMRKLQKHNQGYVFVCLTKGKGSLVHRLVAEAFLPKPEGKDFVNHINGIKTDNRVENLEWVTRQENETHAYSTGLKNSTGVNNTMAKLNDDKVSRIKVLKSMGLSYEEIAKIFSVTSETVNRICIGRIWKHVA